MDLRTEICGMELEHPIINGSGTFDVLAARRAFGGRLEAEFPFSAFVSKTITPEPRIGNPPPLIVSVMAPSREGFETLVERVGARPEVAAIELNVSCPNVKSGLIVGEQPAETM